MSEGAGTVVVEELPGTIGSRIEVDLRAPTGLTPRWTRADLDRMRAEWDRRHLLVVPAPSPPAR